MLKRYSILDVCFIILTLIFVGLSVYEFIHFILPYYTYLRAMIVFVICLGWYVWYSSFQQQKLKNRIPVTQEKQSVVWIKMIKYVQIIFEYSKKYRDIIIYGAFILFVLFLMLGQIFMLTESILYAFLAFICVYIYGKFIWFTIDTRIYVSRVWSIHTFQVFLILYALFFIVLKYISDRFWIPNDERIIIYLGFSLVYIVGGYILFFDISKLSHILKTVFQRFLRPYSAAMTLLIVWLTWYLVVQNNLVSQVIEAPQDSSEIPKWTQQVWELPGIISSEATLDTLWEADREVSYENVLVGNQYDIPAWLALWSTGESVELLQTVLGNLQYFLWEVDGVFGEDTQSALTQALQEECSWPDTTRGIFGPLAKECIDSLEISIEIQETLEDTLEQWENTIWEDIIINQ